MNKRVDEHLEAGGVAVATRREYVIIIERADDNYGAYLPDVPGCVTVGDTVEETVANMREALEAYIEAAQEAGYPIPPPSVQTATVAVEV